MPAKKILVLEDDVVIADIASEILSLEGYEVVCVENGEDALNYFQTAFLSDRPFDLVLIDLTIKDGMGGYETMQKLMALNPNVKGVVTSGFSDDPIMKHYDEYGFVAAIGKPYTTKELVETIERTLGL
jgi:CheY-like chemotaxis protein